MNHSDRAKQRQEWGDKPCGHPQIEAEMEAGHPSDNYVCTTCGRVGKGNSWNVPAAATKASA